MSKIALVQIAVGSLYKDIWEWAMLHFTKKNFFPNDSVEIVLITDQDIHIEGVTVIRIPTDKINTWAKVVCSKVIYINNFFQNSWNDYDYIYYLDADNVFIDILDDRYKAPIIGVEAYWRGCAYGGCLFGGSSAKMREFVGWSLPKIEEDLNAHNYKSTMDEYYWDEWLRGQGVVSVINKNNVDWWVKREELLNPLYNRSGKVFANIAKNNQIAHGSTTLVSHPHWKDYCVVDIDNLYFERNGDRASMSKLANGIYKIHWVDYPNANDIFDSNTNRITCR